MATEVARLNLESDTIAPEVRVTPKDANPRTEVGSVGYALNQLLDNVSSALDVRERTEKQIRAFIADASHELRTPLAAIKGYSDMLRWTEPLADGGHPRLHASIRRPNECRVSWKICCCWRAWTKGVNRSLRTST